VTLVVPRVIPNARGTDQRPLCRRGSMPMWMAHATRKPNDSDRSAEHGIAADRFARKIVRFLTGCPAARSRQLNATPLDGNPSHPTPLLCHVFWYIVLAAAVLTCLIEHLYFGVSPCHKNFFPLHTCVIAAINLTSLSERYVKQNARASRRPFICSIQRLTSIRLSSRRAK